MAALDEVGVDFIESFLKRDGNTTKALSDLLKSTFPQKRGFGLRSIERFCQKHGIRRKGYVSDETLDEAVNRAISQVGPVYGRKMMKGFLDSQVKAHPIASAVRIGHSLKRVNPVYSYQRRQGTERQTNPAPYVAEYYGHKLHIDQNEKLSMYGVTHVCCIDGYSRYIPAFSCMPVKNNVIIYNDIFRKVAIKDGLFDQIRVDHGREFYLTLYVQELLSELRTNPTRDPHRQTESKKNLRIERFWVEVNARVNYPIKNTLRSMEERDIIDMEVEEIKHCVSSVSLKIANFGMQHVIDSWNYHSIPGVGVPLVVRDTNNRASTVAPHLIPTPEDAVATYESCGGHLTVFPHFGMDPLRDDANLLNIREQRFVSAFDVSTVYGNIVNGLDQYFQSAVCAYCDLTRRIVA